MFKLYDYVRSAVPSLYPEESTILSGRGLNRPQIIVDPLSFIDLRQGLMRRTSVFLRKIFVKRQASRKICFLDVGAMDG